MKLLLLHQLLVAACRTLAGAVHSLHYSRQSGQGSTLFLTADSVQINPSEY